MSGESSSNPNVQPSPQTEQWGSLSNLQQETTPQGITSEQDNSHPEKSFTESELTRIAKITSRVPDDPEVIKLNLILRYQKFKQYQDLVQNAKDHHTMVQRGTLEDLATAKRELESAMYAYDDTFAKDDAKAADIDEEQRRYNLKLQSRANKHFSEGPGTPENSWVQARIVRGYDYDRKREQLAEKRAAAAERLFSELPKMTQNMEQSEIYQTYELYKDQFPDQPIQTRRLGSEASKDDDWALYPQSDIKVELTTPKAEKNGTYLEDEEDPSLVEARLAEHLAALEAEKHGTYLEDVENLSTTEIEAFMAKQKAIVDHTEALHPNIEQDPLDEVRDEKIKSEAIVKQAEVVHAENELTKLRSKLAELYAKNRRAIFRTKVKEFKEARDEYSKALDKYFKLKAQIAHEAGENKDDIDAQFLEDYLEQANKLEEATIDCIDNGNAYRKFVSGVINNKYVKTALIAAGIALTVATLGTLGVGIAAGTAALSGVSL